jgi:hypothetical protein
MDQKFHGDDEKDENLDFETLPIDPRPTATGMMVFYRSDSMGMNKNHFARFQMPGNLLKTKNVLVISMATQNFLFINITSNILLHCLSIVI